SAASAKSVLVEAVLAYPYNWSAWLDLAEVLCDEKQHQQRPEEGAGEGQVGGAPAWRGGEEGGWGCRGGKEGKEGRASSRSKYKDACPPCGCTISSRPTCCSSNTRASTPSFSFAVFSTCFRPPLTSRFGAYHPCVLLSTCLIDPLSLLPFLPPSPSLFLPQAQCAIARYNLRDFEEAQEGFRALQEQDPYRLENLERYSDVLYVKESRAELSQLAHIAARNDKYRPETCCIIGNYYSLKGQHERAVLYFQRALRLNRKFLFAWTLMGHGFLEMKNTGAAIEAYRRAVDINPRDYRAWYGLGQTYELLQMYLYAIYYYRKAATLRPFDARMWCAL
ncbi:anaphase-promoting complex subunit 8, partial [Nannochloropsis gaditana CCMP526]|uniref:anaphase-promoting complex subunit 8 n=1 Tax=Nannochloropsis gaditana (strain CCMP526) TaxID=1093141 RepID=UPI00029F5AD6